MRENNNNITLGGGTVYMNYGEPDQIVLGYLKPVKRDFKYMFKKVLGFRYYPFKLWQRIKRVIRRLWKHIGDLQLRD